MKSVNSRVDIINQFILDEQDSGAVGIYTCSGGTVKFADYNSGNIGN